MVWPDVGIYVGAGTSHSWTWFADILERNSIYSVSFLNDAEIRHGGLEHIDVLLISGGDTFAIAEGLGRSGAEQLEKFIAAGGVYIGSCAGAYLPLKSSLAPLNQFNFIASRITNLARNLPAPIKLAEKFCTEYGCQYIFHPVRESVMVKILDGFSCTDNEIAVPLYGGPAMTVSDDIDVLGVYSGFTSETEFLVDETVAQQTLIGNVAIARKYFGRGAFYLFGPHFEHPHYDSANRIVFEAICSGRIKHKATLPTQYSSAGGCCNKNQIHKLRSEISNARIVALALERLPCQWLIGKKVYDPEKIRVFLEAIWRRIEKVHYSSLLALCSFEIEQLIELAQTVTAKLKKLKKDSENNVNTTEEAENLFLDLIKLTANFLTIYFRMRDKRNSELKTPELF